MNGNTKSTCRPFLVLLVLLSLAIFGLYTTALSQESAVQPDVPVKISLSPEQLGSQNGKMRPLVFLSTDKPIYRPGETVYARLVILQADNYFPLRNDYNLAGLAITGPRDNELFNSVSPILESSAGFSWTIPAGTVGGRYLAKASYNGSPEAQRPFEIRVYNPPRLKSQIEFVREGYGPGDTVSAVLSVSRAEGGVPLGAQISAVARVDGVEVARQDGLALEIQNTSNGQGSQTDQAAQGICRVAFTLPESMERGEGTLAFIIKDGGVTETATKTIPILLQTLDLTFYPEGGELIVGMPGRVYVQALRPDGKPADISAQLIRVNATGEALAQSMPLAAIKTVHEGRGSFEFTPVKGERYALRLLEPAGIKRLFPLPAVRASGATLRAEKASYPFAETVSLSVNASQFTRLTLHHREKLVAQTRVAPGQQYVSLNPGEAEGVLIATVWDEAGNPLAERLIFREPRFKVRIGIKLESADTSDAKPEKLAADTALQSVPGGKIRLSLESLDENGRPVEAVIGLSITDDSVLEMVESRDQAPSLPVMVYLENEVKDLADANVYFDPANPNTGRDIDLLLGTQGWRRFVLVRLDEALKNYPEETRRALAIRSPELEIRPLPQVRAAGRDMIMANNVPAPDMMIMKAAPDDELAPPAPVEAQVEAPTEAPLENPVDQAQLAGRADVQEQGEILPDGQLEQEARLAEPRQQADMMAIFDMDEEIQAQKMMQAEPMPYLAIREYAHQNRPNRKPNDRADFTETVYWNAGVRTSPRDGKAMVEFDLSDSVTTFKVRADAYGYNGALGATTADIAAQEPFYVEAKLPPVLVSGDRPLIPLTFANSTNETLGKPGLLLRSESLKTEMPTLPDLLAQASRTRVLLGLNTDAAGTHALTMSAAAAPYADTVTRRLEVLPRGFPVQLTASGLVGPAKSFAREFVIAGDIAPGSLKANLKVYPTPLANLEEALNALLRQPYGCFEQTSSTSYPLVMAQQYFISHSGVAPDKIKKAAALLDESYAKLTSFESPKQGYEWFGGDPGHEALTAYGLMQFSEMKEVMPVDPDMLARTRNWLLSRRDGKGGFERNSQALDSFGQAPEALTNLYITWSLLESGETPGGLKAEISAAKKIAAETKDPYLLALGANILYLAGDLTAAKTAASALQLAQDKDGSLGGAETSITRSRGDSLLIETTSLAILAWLRCGDEYAASVESSMLWLFERCKAGKFGSTQSTILALKAINAYDAARAKPKAPGSLQLMVDGRPFGKPLNFDDKAQGALELPDFSAALGSGEHKVELIMQDGGDMPFALEIVYNTMLPTGSPECPLVLTTALSASEINEGELVELNISLKAKYEDVNMPLAIIGLPAGLEPRHERLKELVAAGQIDSYEINGRELVLYWRGLQAEAEKQLVIPLVAEVPGFYTAPASRAYAYYFDEHKHWLAGENINILPK